MPEKSFTFSHCPRCGSRLSKPFYVSYGKDQDLDFVKDPIDPGFWFSFAADLPEWFCPSCANSLEVVL